MSDEARRLLKELADEMALWRGNKSHAYVGMVERARAFLAQPTAAREAVLVEVLKKAIAWRDEKRTYTLHAGWFTIARRVAADTSPAAAALLDQGEALEEAQGVVVHLWGRLTKEEVDIMPEESKQRVYRHLRAALARAALAPGEENV